MDVRRKKYDLPHPRQPLIKIQPPYFFSYSCATRSNVLIVQSKEDGNRFTAELTFTKLKCISYILFSNVCSLLLAATATNPGSQRIDKSVFGKEKYVLPAYVLCPLAVCIFLIDWYLRCGLNYLRNSN